MFGRSKPVVFEPHGYRRGRSWSIPPWLIILLVGVAVGAGGLLYVQEEYGPKRLTADESQRLQASLDQTESERQRLQGELNATAQKLQTALGENTSLTEQLAESRSAVDALREDTQLFVESLPPDPRGGPIEVRAARFSLEPGNQLGFHVVLTREKPATKPYKGIMQFVVAGQKGGAELHVTLDPVKVSLPGYQHLRGVLPMPDGFVPREATVRVLDSVGGSMRGMRVIYVR